MSKRNNSSNENNNNLSNKNFNNNNLNIKFNNFNFNNTKKKNNINLNKNNNIDSNTNNKNNNIDEFNKMLNNIKIKTKELKKASDEFSNNIRSMPFTLKAFNFITCFIFLTLFTIIHYNLTFSIIFAIGCIISLYLFSTYLAVVFLFLYVVYIVKVSNEKNKSFGVIIQPTNLLKNSSKKAMMCDTTPNNDNIIQGNVYKDQVDNKHFTYSVFLYINGSNPTYKNNFTNYRFREWKSIFYCGNEEISNNNTQEENEPNELFNLNQLPGLWLDATLNNIIFVINDGKNTERGVVENVPLNEWFNITIIMNGASVAIYKNCKMEIDIPLKNYLPDTSEYNLYIANDGALNTDNKNGFSGQIAFLSYYNYLLNQKQINDICAYYGPILKKYQENQNKGIFYETSCLVTDSDVKSI